MERQTNVSETTDIINNAKNYINLKLDLYNLLLNEKLAKISSFFFTLASLIILVSLFLFFISFSFVYWYGETKGELHHGFFIVGVFYLIVGFLVFIFRKKLILNPLISKLTKMLSIKRTTKAKEENEYVTIISMSDLEKEQLRLKEEIVSCEFDIKDDYDQIIESLSFKNISRHLSKNFVSSPEFVGKAISFGYHLFRKKKKDKHSN
jgi:ABC-type multidrug transport system fused ATPase/permease subunit